MVPNFENFLPEAGYGCDFVCVCVCVFIHMFVLVHVCKIYYIFIIKCKSISLSAFVSNGLLPFIYR
jgi:hypothetical protein